MNNDILGELKKVIRGLLIAEKSKGMQLRVLERKYRENEGRYMPLLGFPDTAALLYSLGDTVSVMYDRGQLHVFPVETENTKHVADLVRNTSDKRRRPTASRAPLRRFQPMDKTVITNWLTADNSKKSKRNGPHKFVPNKENNPIMQIGQANQKSRDHRRHPNHHQQQQQHQKQQDNSYQVASTTTTTIQSSDCVVPTKGVQHSHLDAEKCTDDVVAKNDAEAKNVESDSEDEVEIDIDNKTKMARYLLTFNEENIYLVDLPAIKLEQIMQPDKSFRLFLSQVHSPFKFWFQLDENLEMIESLMDRLDHFYYRDSSMMANTAIPNEFLEIGLTCAAMFNSQWHRGKIIDILDETVKVFYMDYGTVSETFKTDIRFLNKRFASEPAFALRGCLDRVRPNDGIWTLKAMDDFLERLKEFFSVPILGKVTLLNVPEQTVYLNLIDTTGKVDIDIGKWLILSNHAYAARKLLFNYQQRHYNEVYPSFERLENGIYPSFDEIKEMKKWNFDFLEFENSIIIPEMYGYQTIE